MAYVEGKNPENLTELSITDLDSANDLILVWDDSANELKRMSPASLGIYVGIQAIYELNATNTNATEIELLTASDARITLANNTTYSYEGIIIAQNSSQSVVFSESISGLIKRVANAASTAFVSSPFGVIAENSDAEVSTRQAADTTNGALGIFGTNTGAEVLNWKAYIRLYRVA